MLNKIIKFSVNNSILVILLTTIFILIGTLSYQSIAIDAVPDLTNVQVQINTSINAMTPDMVESNITYPIENAVSSVPGVHNVRSISRYGLSQVTVIFNENIDIYRARQLVQERIQSVELPKEVHSQMGPITTGLGEIYHYIVEAKKIETNKKKRLHQLMNLRTTQEWDIIPRLASLKGVAEINTIGGFPLQYHITPNIHSMKMYSIQFNDIKEALKKNNYNTGGNFIKQTSERMQVQGIGLIKKISDIKKIPLKTLENFQVITIGDIAAIKKGKEIRTGAALVNGKEAVVGTVLMTIGENSRNISLKVKDKIDSIKKTLPKDITIKTLYTRSDLVNRTLSTVQKNLLFGAILVIIILFLLIGNIRAAVITAIIIPLSLLGTIVLMKLTGISVSLMSLGALDFGIIIDGAVIVIDACVRNVSQESKILKRDLTRQEVKETVIKASSEIRKAAGFGQLVIIIVFIPILAFTGIEGKMFKPMAISFCFALITAFFLSFTLIPALSGLFLSRKANDKKTILMKFIEKIYKPVLNNAIKFKSLYIAGAMLFLLIASVSFYFTGGEFIPRLNEGTLSVQFIRPLTINTEQSLHLEKLSHEKILEFKEVKLVFGRIGTPEVTVHPAGIYHGDTIIMLNDPSSWPLHHGKKYTYEELSKAINDKLVQSIPGQRLMMTQPIELRFNELLEGVKSDISLLIFGEDMEKLENYSKNAAEIIEKINGAGNVEVELRGKTAMLQVIPKIDVLSRYGIPKSTVLDTVSIAIGGIEAGHFYKGVRRFPIIIRLPENIRTSIQSLKQTPVGIGENNSVPLSSLATLKVVDVYNAINRDSSRRRAAVLINPKGRDTVSFVNEAKKKIEKNLKLPPGYFIEWGGNFKNLQSAKERLYIIVPICLALVFFIIYSAFGKIWQTVLLFSTVPLAIAGGTINLFIMGLPFSISAIIGFIALTGIAVLHSLVLVSYYNKLSTEGEEGINLIKKGAMLRLRPVMMTALTDILGFLPMMLATGTGAEVQKPLATVVVGGVIVSTIVTLVLIPVLYNLIEKKIAIKSIEQ